MNIILLLALTISQEMAPNAVVAPAAPTSALQPLRPPPDTTLSRSLKTNPHEDAPLLRELQDSDRVSYLRTVGPWYEVDVRSAEGLEFRGWLKGSTPVARTAPVIVPRSPTKKSDGPNPLNVEGITWFWDSKAQKRGSIRFGTGFQNVSYSLSGTVSGVSQKIPPGYNFMGWNLGMVAEFIPMHTEIWRREFFPVIRAAYSFGLHRVSFSNPFSSVPEVAGKAYQITTNTYSLDGIARMKAVQFNGGYLQLGLGIGFMFQEVQPDLDPIQGGVYNGQIIFLDTAFNSLTIPLEIHVRAWDDYYFEPRIVWLALPSFSENATNSPQMEAEGLPLQIQMTIGYQMSEKWALEFNTEYLAMSGKSSGTATRLGTTYSDGKIDLGYQKYVVGLNYGF